MSKHACPFFLAGELMCQKEKKDCPMWNECGNVLVNMANMFFRMGGV